MATPVAGGDEGDETVEGTDEGGEAEDLLGGGGVLAAEEVLLSKLAQMASTQRAPAMRVTPMGAKAGRTQRHRG